MNRADFQKLCNSRLREAKILFAAQEYSGAYYLAGYAIEFALKACYARGVKRYDFPDKTAIRNVFVHDPIKLLEQSHLTHDLLIARKANRRFAAGWDIVLSWSEESRYRNWTKDDAEAMLDAISRRRDGVLPWIKRRW